MALLLSEGAFSATMVPVNEQRWVNPHQPQTLYMASVLCYLEAGLGVLGLFTPLGSSLTDVLIVFPPIGFIVLVGLAAGGWGIANEKKWAYPAAIVASALLVLSFLALAFGNLFSLWAIVSLFFDVILVVLLVHPMSRDYQRIWFR